jgi:hypothetical protein
MVDFPRHYGAKDDTCKSLSYKIPYVNTTQYNKIERKVIA